MKKQGNLPLSVQVENLESANHTLRNYVQTLEQKVERYERILQNCPRFRAEQQLEDDYEDDDFDDFDDFEEDEDFDDLDDFDDDDFDDFDDFDDDDFEDEEV